MNHKGGAYAPVFYPAIICVIIISLFGIFCPQILDKYISLIQSKLLDNFGWVYILSMSIFLCVCLFLMISQFGKIKLGKDHEQPKYSNISWFAMLFAAGMGIGLMFYGVAEPLIHYTGANNLADSPEHIQYAMNTTLFHWGIGAWSVYGIVGLSLAYFSFRHNLPLLPRSMFYPLVKQRIYGPIGHAIDVFAIIGTIFGVATSLGFGSAQISAGMNYMIGIPDTTNIQIIYIIIITLMATISVATGLDKGIKFLSNLNIILAVLLMLIVVILGNSSDIVKDLFQNTGYYISHLVDKTFDLYAYNPDKQAWLNQWTLFYWGWWIAWSPFVGMFIAKVSRGRTIREFIVGVLFIPVGFTFMWMTVFGNSAIDIIINNPQSPLVDAVQNNIPSALFQFLQYFPFSTFTCILAILLIVSFFVTSADSGALVIDVLATGDAKESKIHHRIMWSSFSGILAITLLLSGGLSALQSATVISAFPLMIIFLIMIFSLMKALKLDLLKSQSIENHSTVIQYIKSNTTWQQRLSSIVDNPNKKDVKNFITNVVIPAINEISKSLEETSLITDTVINNNSVEFRIFQNASDVESFVYIVKLENYENSEYLSEDIDSYHRAEVFLSHGCQHYDIMGYTKEQIIADIVENYDKHIHYLHMANN